MSKNKSMTKKLLLTDTVAVALEENKRTDWNISKSLDSEAKEAKKAFMISKLYPKFRLRQNKGKYCNSYADTRAEYLLERLQERDPANKEDMFVQFFQHRYKQIKSYFEGNEWILNIIFVIIDALFCFMYLLEIESNIIRSCEKSGCGTINLPSWLLVYRLNFSYHLLVLLSSLRLLFLVLSGSLFATAGLWSYYFENLYTVLSIFVCAPFLALSRVTDSRYIYIPYWLAIFTLLFNLKAWLVHKKAWAPFRITEYKEKFVLLVAYLIALIFSGMSLFNYFETRFKVEQGGKDDQNLTLVRTFYFMVITMSTVGYGDITPNTALGQISIVLIILVALVLLPALVNDLYDTIKRQAKGEGSYGNYGNPFLVVCGDFEETWRILEFIHTLLKRSEKGKATHVVLLSRGEIPSDLLYAIKHTTIRDRVFFIRGNALESKCFARVRLDCAEAAFILAKGRVRDERLEDEANTLRAWAVDHYAPNINIYLETRLPQTQYVLQDDSTMDVICIAEFKQIFLAYNCLYKGFSTVLLNLLRGTKSRHFYEKPWQCQYADGAENEIFRLPINPIFHCETFSTMSFYIYRHFQIIAFAVDIYLPESDSFHLSLNPGLTYRFKPGDYCFFIAQSNEIASSTLLLKKTEYDRTKILNTKVFRNLSLTTPLPSSTNRNPSSKSPLFSFVIGYPPINTDEKAPLCILIPQPLELEDSVIEDASLFSGHFLVCSNDFNLFRFFCTLRSAHLSQHEIITIVILCYRAPTQEEFARLRYFPKVSFLVGDYRQTSVLKRAGLFQCSRVVLTNVSSQKCTNQEVENFEFEDTTTIMLANLIEKMFRDAGIPNSPVCDISLRVNIHLLGYSSRSFFKKSATKEEKYTDSQIKLIDDGYLSPFYAAGNVISPVMLENLVSNSYHLPSTIKLFNCFSGVRFQPEIEIDLALNIQVSNLRYILVPQGHVSKTFGELYQVLSSMGILAIGILRDNLGTDLENPLPFVYTNPPWSLTLKESDFVYVLAPQVASNHL